MYSFNLTHESSNDRETYQRYSTLVTDLITKVKKLNFPVGDKRSFKQLCRKLNRSSQFGKTNNYAILEGCVLS